MKLLKSVILASSALFCTPLLAATHGEVKLHVETADIYSKNFTNLVCFRPEFGVSHCGDGAKQSFLLSRKIYLKIKKPFKNVPIYDASCKQIQQGFEVKKGETNIFVFIRANKIHDKLNFIIVNCSLS